METKPMNLVNCWFSRKTLFFMKNFILIMLVSTLNMYASSSYSQQAKLSMELSGSELKEVLKEIRKQTEFTVLYRSSDVEDVRNLEANFENATVIEILDECLKGTGLGYDLEDKVIVIHPVVQEEMAKPVMEAEAQEKEVKGTVTDSYGEPLPGVSVVVKGTNIGVATDIDGNYQIALPDDAKTLIYSFVGMTPKEVAYTGQTVINVSLTEDTEQMAEVVVTGYQTLSKERATGAFHQIKNEALSKTVSTDLITKIEGAIPGVQVKDDKVTIRGVSRINGDTNPLIVIDGFPTEVALSDINSNDIATITVLKDAAAASIWGVKAGNGVIVITTKGGTSKKPTFNASYSFTLGLIPDMKKQKLLNSSQYVDLEKETIEKGFWSPAYVNYGYGTNGVQEAFYQFSKDNDQEKFDATLAELSKINAQKEMEDLFLQTQQQHMFDIGVSGQTDFINYYASVQLQDNQAFSKGVKSQSVNFFNKNVFKITDKLSIGTNITVNYGTNEGSGIGLQMISRATPYERVYDDEGNAIRYYKSKHHSIAKPMEEQGYLPLSYSMVDNVKYVDNEANTLMARANISLNYEIFKGLKYSLKYQNEIIKSSSDNLNKVGSATTNGYINNYLKFDENGNPIYHVPYGDILETRNSTIKNWSVRNQLDFNREFGKFRLNAILGTEIRKYTKRDDFSRLFGYDSEALSSTYVDLASLTSYSYQDNGLGGKLAQMLKPGVSMEDNRDFSNYTNIAVTFDDKYTLTASGRVDQSNLWGKSKKYKFNPLWSVGGSWNISSEKWFESKFVDNLKLRLTYGVNGSVNKSFYPVLTGYYSNRLINNNNFKQIRLTNPANDDLKWENTEIANLGINFSLFNRFVYGSLDVYRKNSIDLIGSQRINPTYGWESATTNYASMTNKGVDLSLTFDWLNKGDFSVSSTLNLSYNKNEVTKIDTDTNYTRTFLASTSSYSGLPIKGYGMGRVFSYKYGGLNDKGEIQIWGPNRNGTGEKELYNAAVDHQLVGNNFDFVSYEGESVAPYYGGFNTDIRYKGLNLRFDFVYNFGGVMRMPVGTISDFRMGNVTNTIDKRWRKAGDELTTNVPGIKDFYTHNYYGYDLFYTGADINIESSDYVKLRNIILDYNLPQSFVKKLKLNSLSLKFQASNLWYWAANSRNIDPEKIDPGAVENNRINLPDAQTFIFGIKTSF
jgi:TonB-linked SusC/RagA family outer membrane protein